MSRIPRKYWAPVLALAMLAAVIAEAYVLFYVEDPQLRLGFGMLLMVLAVGPFAPISRLPEPDDSIAQLRPPRHFSLLRRWTTEFLREVRRLNWLRFDATRGITSRTNTIREIEAIEARLSLIIDEIKQAAGRMDVDSDMNRHGAQAELQLVPREDLRVS